MAMEASGGAALPSAEFETCYGSSPEGIRNIAAAMGCPVEEYQLLPGRLVLELPCKLGGSLQVMGHPVLEEEEQQQPRSGWTKEWRVLRLNPHISGNLVQSITKVHVPPPELRGHRPIQHARDALPLEYNRAVATVSLAGLALLGAPVVEAAAGEAPKSLRFLCLGLGGGAVPAFFVQALEDCYIEVAELEAAVVQAAVEAMGFPEGPRLRAFAADGAKFATQRLNEGIAYDAVVVDACDERGHVPAKLQCRNVGLAKALSRGLLRPRGLVVVNLPRGGEPMARATLAAYAGALGGGLSFCLQSSSGNIIGVHMRGPGLEGISKAAALQDGLGKAAREVERATDCSFDMCELLAHCNLKALPSLPSLVQSAAGPPLLPQRNAVLQHVHELVVAFSEEHLQRELAALYRADGIDQEALTLRRNELLWPIISPLLVKYGYEASPRGLAQCNKAYTHFGKDGECRKLFDHKDYLLYTKPLELDAAEQSEPAVAR